MKSRPIKKQAGDPRHRAQQKWVLKLRLGLTAIFMMMMASSAQSIDIQIDENVTLRTAGQMNDGHEVMTKVGELSRGTEVSIDPKYVVRVHGRINLKATLDHWEWSETHSTDPNRPRFTAYQNDDKSIHHENYFPVKIVKAAPGSVVPTGIGQPFISLKAVANSGRALIVGQRTPVYARRSSAGAAGPDAAMTATYCVSCHANDGAPLSTVAQQSVNDTAAALRPQTARPGTMAPDGSFVPEVPTFPRYRGDLRANCSNFIKPDGSYGPYGKMLAQEISRYPIYFSPESGISRQCRDFNSWTDKNGQPDRAHQLNFLIYAFESLSGQESQCDPGNQADAKENQNGVAVGLFQIEWRNSLRVRRDQLWGGRFCEGDPFDPAVNIRCAVRTMVDHLRTGEGLYNAGHQYWHSFRDPQADRQRIYHKPPLYSDVRSIDRYSCGN